MQPAKPCRRLTDKCATKHAGIRQVVARTTDSSDQRQELALIDLRNVMTVFSFSVDVEQLLPLGVG
jgi:hypothetical protein